MRAAIAALALIAPLAACEDATPDFGQGGWNGGDVEEAIPLDADLPSAPSPQAPPPPARPATEEVAEPVAEVQAVTAPDPEPVPPVVLLPAPVPPAPAPLAAPAEAAPVEPE